jgi:hypothetical protein
VKRRHLGLLLQSRERSGPSSAPLLLNWPRLRRHEIALECRLVAAEAACLVIGEQASDIAGEIEQRLLERGRRLFFDAVGGRRLQAPEVKSVTSPVLPVGEAAVEVVADVRQRDAATGGNDCEIPENVAQLLDDVRLVAEIGRAVALLLLDDAEQAPGLAEQAKQRKSERGFRLFVSHQGEFLILGQCQTGRGVGHRGTYELKADNYKARREFCSGGIMPVEAAPFSEVGKIEQLALVDKTNLTLEASDDGKIRVGISTWTDTQIVLKDQVLEVRNVNGQLRISKKVRRYDEKDPYVEPYDPYGPGTAADIQKFLDEEPATRDAVSAE